MTHQIPSPAQVAAQQRAMSSEADSNEPREHTDHTEQTGQVEDPTEGLTPDEQINYWKDQTEKWKSLSRKHEKKWQDVVNASDTAISPEHPIVRTATVAELRARQPHLSTEQINKMVDLLDLAKILGGDGTLDLSALDLISAPAQTPPQVTLGGILGRSKDLSLKRVRSPQTVREDVYNRYTPRSTEQ